jgi:hypothetical protein
VNIVLSIEEKDKAGGPALQGVSGQVQSYLKTVMNKLIEGINK